MNRDKWACGACTSLNPNDAVSCSICYSINKEKMAEIDVAYQWFSDPRDPNGGWITFDSIKIHEKLEKGYEEKKSEVFLEDGAHFGQRKKQYKVQFIWDKDELLGLYQKNTWTGFRRRVRRVDRNDEKVFVFVSLEQKQSEDTLEQLKKLMVQEKKPDVDKNVNHEEEESDEEEDKLTCSICFKPFDEIVYSKDHKRKKAKDIDPVRLKKCGNHDPFHRKCLLEWIKIKSNCPICRGQI